MKVLEWIHTRAARRANYGLLLTAMLLVILGYPILADLGIHAPRVLSGFFTIVLIGCLAAAIQKTYILGLLFAVVVLLELVAGIFDIGGPGPYSAMQHATRAGVLFLTALILLRDVMRASSVETDTILGAICVYLLLGLVGADVYALIMDLDPVALVVTAELLGESVDPRETLSITTYYSFVTLTTLGYGDVTPVSAAARAVTTVQAATGQLYIAVIVARLVALHVTSASANRASGRPVS